MHVFWPFLSRFAPHVTGGHVRNSLQAEFVAAIEAAARNDADLRGFRGGIRSEFGLLGYARGVAVPPRKQNQTRRVVLPPHRNLSQTLLCVQSRVSSLEPVHKLQQPILERLCYGSIS